MLDQAGQFARGVRQAAREIETQSSNTSTEIRGSVKEINRLAGQLRTMNAAMQNDLRNTKDPGLDAQMHAALEELSQYASVQGIRQSDGTFTVLLNGQTPLVIGDRQYDISADLSSPEAKIRDVSGKDVTSQASGGKLGALLELKNGLLSSWSAKLDALASFVADSVNTQLAAGIDQAGLPGAALFSHGATRAAATLDVTGISTTELAAAAPGAAGGNGNALLLAGLSTSALLDGVNMTGVYSALASDFGGSLQAATSGKDTATDLLSQVKSLREQQSGVSLDEEAARLIEFQRSYEAAAKLVTVLNEMTQTCLDMLR